jgi:hypothetical protein
MAKPLSSRWDAHLTAQPTHWSAPSSSNPSMQFSDTTVRSQGSEKRKVSEQFKFDNDTTKVFSLMDYRKAKGLCYKCGLKWGPTHKCISTIPLHVVEELWQVLDPYVTTVATSHIQDDSGDDLMILSVHALQGTEALQTMKLLASLGLVRFYPNPYGLMGIEGVSIPSKPKSLPIRINPLRSIWIENNRTSP